MTIQMASNFQFLQDEFRFLWEPAHRMESLGLGDPRGCLFYARRTLELMLKWLYDHDDSLKFPYSSNLAALLEEPSLKKVVEPAILTKFRYIRQYGNIAVHSHKPLRQYEAMQAVKEVFHCCFWFATHYTEFSPKKYEGTAFDEQLLQPAGEPEPKASPEQLQKLSQQLEEKDKALREKEQTAEGYDAEIKNLRTQIAKIKRRNQSVAIQHDYDEAATRDNFIDLLLREAGWDPDFDDGKFKCREYEVRGMPNQKGVGYVDYVLWSHEKVPLAVVEAKRTKRDPRVGRNQAKLYADCLEEMTGHRPVIFYTNGHEHWIWDDVRFPPRAVQGFFKEDELKLLIERRETAQDLTSATVDKAIAGRYYQEQAIRQVTEAMMAGQRRALIVMATGAGKTRTVVALSDLLQRCNWIKRVLFLADRVALVNQAVNAFKAHLPHSNPVNLVTDRESTASRVYVSTYPTMMGLIDDADDGKARFGSGHFDLVVIDEAHRSVYQKYRAIFDYFDSYLIGLTATPKDEVDRDTYGLFELVRGVPTYAYELEQAVEDGYLVPPKLVSVPTKFPREGIKYDSLSEEEKDQWDMIEWDEDGSTPRAVESAAVNKWLFNIDTVDKVLEHVMSNGLRVDGGQTIGKTIIFAKNHDHALFIQERFDANYPHLKGKFARVIDNKETYAQDLIDKFSAKRGQHKDAPTIAISVDMLDTGIDVPDVLNLVFFKVVRSKTKFWQMIGRGTRLCPDVFGKGEDKEAFFVFDYCGNFEFFNEFPEGVEGNAQESITARLFKQRLDLLDSIRKAKDSEGEGEINEASDELDSVESDLVDVLHGEVISMPLDNFMVRAKRKHVETFQKKERWADLNVEDFSALYSQLADLPRTQEPEHPDTKYFDLLILRLQHAILTSDPAQAKLITRVKEIASELETLDRIPAVKKELILIQEVQSDEYWEGVTLPMLEVLRVRLRNLVPLIEKRGRKKVISDFEDEIGEGAEVELPELGAAIDRGQYRKKFLEFLNQHEDVLALKKVKYNEALTRMDIEELERILFESGELGDREEFEKCYGEQANLGLFLRKLVGLDREAAKKAFDAYLDTTSFTARQIAFVNQIIDYLTQNGIMDPKMLFQHPFTNFGPDGPTSIFDDEQAAKIIHIIRAINANAEAVR